MFRFQFVPVRIPFSNSAVFKLFGQNICRFRVNVWGLSRTFPCLFQIMPARHRVNVASFSLIANISHQIPGEDVNEKSDLRLLYEQFCAIANLTWHLFVKQLSCMNNLWYKPPCVLTWINPPDNFHLVVPPCSSGKTIAFYQLLIYYWTILHLVFAIHK